MSLKLISALKDILGLAMMIAGSFSLLVIAHTYFN